MNKLFYSTSEVAAIIKVNRVTVYRWIKEGKIAACEIGKRFKIPAEEVSRMARDFGISGGLLLDMCKRTGPGTPGRTLSVEAGREEQRLVMAVDERKDLRTGIQEVVESARLSPHFRVLIFPDTVSAALEMGRVKPDVLVVGVSGSRSDGVDFAVRTTALFAGIPVVFIVDDVQRYTRDHEDEIGALGADVIHFGALREELQGILARRLEGPAVPPESR